MSELSRIYSDIEQCFLIRLNDFLLHSTGDTTLVEHSTNCVPFNWWLTDRRRQKTEILVDMSESPVCMDESFQSKLSSLITRSFSENNGAWRDSTELASSVIAHYGSVSETGGEKPSSLITSPTVLRSVPAEPSTMAALLTAQRASYERLRKGALLPILQPSQSFDANGKQGKQSPNLASLARCQKLKRVLEIYSDTIKIEEELLKIWSNEKTSDPLKVFTRRRSMEILEQSTQTLTEISKEPLTAGRKLSRSSSAVAGSTLTNDEGIVSELTIYHTHEAVGRILRTLVDLGSTMPAQVDDNTILSEFDAIGKRRESSSTSPTIMRNQPRLINYATAIDMLLAAMPTNYNFEVLKAIGS